MRNIFFAALMFFSTPVFADQDTVLLAALNVKVDDATNEKWSIDEKYDLMGRVGEELAREFIFSKLDTFYTIATIGIYDTQLNADFAGALAMAYIKKGTKRTWMEVRNHEELRQGEQPEGNSFRYVFLMGESILGIHSIPTRDSDMIIIEYYAYPNVDTIAPDTLGSGVEWQIPNAYEEAALDIVAGKLYKSLETPWALQIAKDYDVAGRTRIQEIKNATPVTVQAGDVTR